MDQVSSFCPEVFSVCKEMQYVKDTLSLAEANSVALFPPAARG